MHIIPKSEQKTTAWSGGTTTELLIYPENAEYALRNFNFRLSTATVEIQTSTFTPLPGIKRTLMVLDGEMELIHQGHHRTTLTSLMTDTFEGDWNTTSIGKCTDFNLMCRGNTKGTLIGYYIPKETTQELLLDSVSNFLYLSQGAIEINNTQVEEGALVILDKMSGNQTIKAITQSKIVLVQILEM